jgi:arylsulfatase A-like enzyme
MRRSKVNCPALVPLFFALVMSADAGLISHYVFTDGDLLDNEVAGGPALTNAGPTAVTLGNGTAVFASEPQLNDTGDNYLISGNASDLNLGTFTVSFWMRTDTVDQGGPFQGIFASRATGADANSWQFFSDGSDTTGTTATAGETLIRGGVGTQTDSPFNTIHLPDTWYHVAFTSNDADNALIMTISSEGGTLGDLASGVVYARDVQLDHLVFGTNRALNQTYGMELANIQIYNSVENVGALWSEGPLIGPIQAPPVIDSFTVSDHYVAPGSSVTLDWVTTGADTVTLSSEIGPVALSGSVGKTIATTTTFTLTASNANGSVEESLTVYTGPPRPNILIFLVDDMGITDTSVPFIFSNEGVPLSYGFNSLFQTPNMELLASRGMVFSNAYAQTVCSPTRTSLMTGLNATGHGVTCWVNPTGTRIGSQSPVNYLMRGMTGMEETLPRWLGAAGYRNIHSGKAHFTYQFNPNAFDEEEDPTFIGFDVNIGGSSNGQPGSYLGTQNYASAARPAWTIPGLEAYHGTSTFLTEACTIEAMKEVTRSSVDRGQPFFLYLSHYAVHTPFTSDPRATGNYSAAGSTTSDAYKFCTMVEGMDRSLGDVLAHLDSLGIAEETLIIFLGDNGSDSPMLNHNAAPDAGWNDFPMRGKKGNRSEGGSRVPLIISWAKPDPSNPFQQTLPIAAGSHEDDIVACWDLPVTAMSVAGVPLPAPVHGYDLSGYLAGTPGEHRPQEILIYSPHGRDGDYFANYREHDWKLIYQWESNHFELYNLATDPTESNNLAPTNPEKVLGMARGMARRFAAEWGIHGTLWPTFGPLSTAGVMGTLDLDGDGRIDSFEDANANGLRDPGETDPDDGDTDDDGSDDHTEVRLGLNPLNPTSFFRALIRPALPGGYELRWPSQPGLTFTIRHCADLSTPLSGWTTVSGVPSAGSGNESTWIYNGPDARRFFTIELE